MAGVLLALCLSLVFAPLLLAQVVEPTPAGSPPAAVVNYVNLTVMGGLGLVLPWLVQALKGPLGKVPRILYPLINFALSFALSALGSYVPGGKFSWLLAIGAGALSWAIKEIISTIDPTKLTSPPR
jgi:hypothetical protein